MCAASRESAGQRGKCMFQPGRDLLTLQLAACVYTLSYTKVRVKPYGVRLLQTRLSRDQLDSADAGSWQIADRYATAS